MADKDEILFSPAPGSLKMAPPPKPDRVDPDGSEIMFAGPPEKAPKQEGKLLDNAPGESDTSSVLKGAGTALIKGVAGIPGMFGDVENFSSYLAQRAMAALQGKSHADFIRDRDEKFAKLRAEGKVLPGSGTWKPTSKDIYDPILKKTGEYEPTTTAGKYAMTAVEAVPSAFIPGGLARGATAAQARGALASSAKTVPALAVAAPVGLAAAEATDEPLAALVAAPAVASAVGAGQRAIADRLPTTRQSTKQAIADRTLLEGASDPQQAFARATAPNRDPLGVKATLGETTGDKNLLLAERQLNATDEGFQHGLQTVRDRQNTARAAALNDLQATGDPQAVTRAFDDTLAQLETHHEGLVTAARQRAESAAQALPNAHPDELGAITRSIQGAAEERANAARRALYDAVDPDGSLVVVTDQLSRAAQQLIAEHPPTAAALTVALDPINKAQSLRSTTSFRDLRGLDTNITQAMKKAKLAGDLTDHAALVQLKDAVKQSMNEAVKNQVRWEQQQVARGILTEDQTIAVRLREQIRAFYDQQRATGSADGTVGATGRTSAGDPGMAGAARASREGSPDPARGAPIPGDPAPNFDESALQRLREANEAHAAYARQFREGPTGALLATTGFNDQYKLLNSRVPATVFVSGPAGYETAQQIMRASNNSPDIVRNMQDIASVQLRNNINRDGVLTQQGLDRWRSQYGEALRAIDEVSPGFSARYDNVATASQAMADAIANRDAAIGSMRMGIARNMLGLRSEDDIVGQIGTMLNSKMSGTRTADMVSQLAHNPEALDGARRAGVLWMQNQLTNAGMREGQHIMSGAKMLNFVDKHQDALRALYGDDGVARMNAIADDLRRMQEAMTVQGTPGSPTAPNLSKLIRESAAAAADNSTIGTMFGMALWDAVASMSPAKLAGVVASKFGWGALNKLRARGIRDINDLVVQGMLNPDVGAAMMRRAMNGPGDPNTAGFAALLSALDRANGIGDSEEAREGRASGGRIQIDHGSEADKLVKQADRARQDLGTEKLLQQPDEAIVKALSIANGLAA